MLRFGRAKALLDDGRLTLADLALECGYYDQAHLNRDFRGLRRAARRPSSSRGGCPPGTRREPQVTSVQDGARAAA